MIRARRGSLILLLASLAGGCGGPVPPSNSKTFQIAVIPKGTTHDFWKSIHAGAVAAANERGNAQISWEGPSTEDQRAEQQQIVERFTSDAVSAIVLAPTDRRTLVAPVEEALKAGIPVVIIDSGLEQSPIIKGNSKYLGYVATDNKQGGVEAAKRMIELLKDKPHAKVLMIRYQAGSESTEKREAGFRETMKAEPNIQFDEAPDDAGATVDSAQRVAERLLSDRKDVDGIFVPNESSTTGVLQAIELLHRTGQIKLVGFDGSALLIQALQDGKLHGLVLQDPFGMCRQAVLRALDFLEGKGPPKDLIAYTNLRVVTKENMKEKDIEPLYHRDLKPFIGE